MKTAGAGNMLVTIFARHPDSFIVKQPFHSSCESGTSGLDRTCNLDYFIFHPALQIKPPCKNQPAGPSSRRALHAGVTAFDAWQTRHRDSAPAALATERKFQF